MSNETENNIQKILEQLNQPIINRLEQIEGKVEVWDQSLKQHKEEIELRQEFISNEVEQTLSLLSDSGLSAQESSLNAKSWISITDVSGGYWRFNLSSLSHYEASAQELKVFFLTSGGEMLMTICGKISKAGSQEWRQKVIERIESCESIVSPVEIDGVTLIFEVSKTK